VVSFHSIAEQYFGYSTGKTAASRRRESGNLSARKLWHDCDLVELHRDSCILAYIEEHNRQPKPFIWTAKANDILAKVKRAKANLNNSPSV